MHKENKKLVGFVVLSYLDKALVFLLPIIVLYISKNEGYYNDVEYICSVANIIVPFLNFISIYSFFGYKESADKEKFTANYRLYSAVTTILISLISLGILLLWDELNFGVFRYLELYIAIRVAFYSFVQYYNSYFRLKDKPLMSLVTSIVINFLSVAAMLVIVKFDNTQILKAFFFPEMLIISVSVFMLVQQFKSFSIREYLMFLFEALKFSWPILLSSSVVAFVTNYGKVYAFNFLSGYEMYCVSFLLRIVLVIQLAHSSLISFFSKEIYLKGFTKNFIATYLVVISTSLLGFFAVLIGYNNLIDKDPIPIDRTCIFVLIYTLLHLIGTIFEIDFNRKNKNIYIFVFSVISCGVYLLLIFGIGVKGINSLTLYMVIYIIIYLFLLICGWKKIKSQEGNHI